LIAAILCGIVAIDMYIGVLTSNDLSTEFGTIFYLCGWAIASVYCFYSYGKG